MSKPNNPPAFPQSLEIHVPEGGAYTRIESMPGMTLRDYFAAKAMSAAMANPYTGKEIHNQNIPKSEQKRFLVENAYEIADAMLEERAK